MVALITAGYVMVMAFSMIVLAPAFRPPLWGMAAGLLFVTFLFALLLLAALLKKDVPQTIDLKDDGITTWHLTGPRRLVAQDLESVQVSLDVIGVGLAFYLRDGSGVTMLAMDEHVAREVARHLVSLGVRQRPDHAPMQSWSRGRQQRQALPGDAKDRLRLTGGVTLVNRKGMLLFWILGVGAPIYLLLFTVYVCLVFSPNRETSLLVVALVALGLSAASYRLVLRNDVPSRIELRPDGLFVKYVRVSKLYPVAEMRNVETTSGSTAVHVTFRLHDGRCDVLRYVEKPLADQMAKHLESLGVPHLSKRSTGEAS